MKKQSWTNLRNCSRMGAALIGIFMIYTSPALAQDGSLVITTSSAEAIKSEVNYRIPSVSIDGDIGNTFEPVNMEKIKKQRFGIFSRENFSTYKLEAQDSSTLSLGVLSNGSETPGGVTRRNPYSVESVEVDPLYPEGIYVDEMRATAGIGLRSEF